VVRLQVVRFKLTVELVNLLLFKSRHGVNCSTGRIRYVLSKLKSRCQSEKAYLMMGKVFMDANFVIQGDGIRHAGVLVLPFKTVT